MAHGDVDQAPAQQKTTHDVGGHCWIWPDTGRDGKIRYVARHPYNGTAPEQGSTWPCKRPLGVVTCNHNELGVQTS